MVVAQDDETGTLNSDPGPNHTLVANLAKAFQWQEQLESGEYATFDELARANGVDRTYVGRILRLTSLAPCHLESILNGQETDGLSLRQLMLSVPLIWKDQRFHIERLGMETCWVR
jgi:hypothetical protein